jgi:hypothetical protein
LILICSLLSPRLSRNPFWSTKIPFARSNWVIDLGIVSDLSFRALTSPPSGTGNNSPPETPESTREPLACVLERTRNTPLLKRFAGASHSRLTGSRTSWRINLHPHESDRLGSAGENPQNWVKWPETHPNWKRIETAPDWASRSLCSEILGAGNWGGPQPSWTPPRPQEAVGLPGTAGPRGRRGGSGSPPPPGTGRNAARPGWVRHSGAR